MIPLATPRDNEILNLSQIVRVRVHKAGKCHECWIAKKLAPDSESGTLRGHVMHVVGEQSACTVYFSDGTHDIFTGDESKFLNIELHFLLNTYRQMQQQSISPPAIVTPNGQPPSGGLVM